MPTFFKQYLSIKRLAVSGLAALGVFVALGQGHLTSTKAFADTEAAQISAFSSRPVPRFESLRFSAVHGRQGPSLEHPIVWRYERQGLPVIVVRETQDWRLVRDKDGDEVWVQARMLSSERHIITTKLTSLRKTPSEQAEVLAELKPEVVAELTGCQNNWCEVRIQKFTGWVPQGDIWGSALAISRQK